MSLEVKPLAIDQQVLMWLSVLPANENISKSMRLAKIALVLFLIAADITVFASGLMYALKYVSIDFQEFSSSLLFCIAAIPMANSIAMAFLYRHKIPAIFESLSKIYDKCMYEFEWKWCRRTFNPKGFIEENYDDRYFIFKFSEKWCQSVPLLGANKQNLWTLMENVLRIRYEWLLDHQCNGIECIDFNLLDSNWTLWNIARFSSVQIYVSNK